VPDGSTSMMKPNEQEEFELAVQAQTGDRDALSRLAEANHITIYACWLSGFDLCLTKPVKPEEFENLARRLRENMASNEEGRDS
jgi:hypothetical protein